MLRVAVSAFVFSFICSTAFAADDVDALTKQLSALDGRVIVLGTVRQPPLVGMLARHAEARLRLANRADQAAWNKVQSREDWEKFREEKLRALQASLGQFPPVPRDMLGSITSVREGDGFEVWNLAFVTRPGLVVTANLYRPLRRSANGMKLLPPGKLPGILLCHSHQSTKHSGSRQDMAMTWARAGCVVLVPDHLGHGERRQHPFGGEGQHDYHFRYDASLQLHLVGESLMGWLVWDLMRCVDVLRAARNVDEERIAIISEPAGGGDVAAVTAALDPRITCAMIQNFGGPQPEAAYPLPANATDSFAFAGSGSWESTRNLRLSARDGFLPWSIVASIAPRKLIYFHEFYWDREHDPVWKRLQQVFAWHDQREALVGLAGRGFVVGSAPENTHWLPENRALLYPVLEKWFEIPNPGQEYSQRMPEQDLHCLTPDYSHDVDAQPLQKLLANLAADLVGTARNAPKVESANWLALLGSSAAEAKPVLVGEPIPREKLDGVEVERIHLATEPGIVVPVLLLRPSNTSEVKLPVVIGVAQQGKQEFLKQRAEVIARLLRGGSAVCLVDVRGTGESSQGDDRGRRSSATSVSATELMLGQTVLGGQLHDLRAVLRHLRLKKDLDLARIAVWGESFLLPNAPDTRFNLPHTATRPPSPEPMGGLLALFAGHAEEKVRAVYVHRGLFDYQTALQSPFCYLPHDAVIPGCLTHGDLPDLAAALAPRKVWMHEPVDACNRAISKSAAEKSAYDSHPQVRLTTAAEEYTAIADWLLAALLQ